MGCRGRLLALVLLLAGCLEPQLQTCGDKLCAVDSVCLASGQCATAEAVAACMGLADGAACQTAVFDGTCSLGACVAARCGDHVVSGSEQCDGSVTDQDCVQFGFDLGLPSCNERCDLDLLSTCQRFGWERTLSLAVDSIWVGTSGIAFTRALDAAAEVRWNGQPYVDNSDYWRGVIGTATTVFAYRPDAVLRSTGGPWERMTAPTLADGEINVAVTDDGTLYIGEQAACVLYKLAPNAPAWQPILNDPVGCRTVFAHGNELVVGFMNGDIRRYNGTSWTSVFAATGDIGVVAEVGSTLYYSLAAGGLYRRVGSQLDVLSVDTALIQMVASGNDVYFDGGDGYGRIAGLDIEYLTVPTGGLLAGDAAGNVYVFRNGVYRFTGTDYSRREGIEQLTFDIGLLADGKPFVTTQGGIWLRENTNNWTGVYPGEFPLAVAGWTATDYYVTTGTLLLHTDGVITNDVTPAGFTGITDLWAGPSNELVAVGDGALIMGQVSGTWTTHQVPTGTSGCNLTAVAGTASTLFAAGACGATGIVWRRTGAGTWTEVYRAGPPLAAVAVATDGEVFAAGPQGGARTRGGVWESDDGAIGISITATTANDVFVGGGPAEVVHWNGTEWSRLNTRGAITPRVVATPRALYIGGASQSVLIR